MIILMGPVGSGKGTQSEILAKEIGYTHLSSGDLVRTFASKDQLARMVKGEYLRGEEIIELVAAALQALPDENRVILDGLPRTTEQLDWVLQNAKDGRWEVEAIFNLMIPSEVAWERLRGRGRADDTESAIAARLDFYLKETKPLLDSLRQQGFHIIDIDGSQSVEDVHEAILAALKQPAIAEK